MRKWLLCCAVALVLVARAGASTSYTTTFPFAENPISEGSVWTNGHTVGMEWSDVRTTPGLAFGTQSGAGGYDDSIAVLKGVWSPDQAATATVYTVNQVAGNVYEEAEILLRFAITPHTARGYEINFSMRNDGSQYSQIVRWNGASGDFTLLDSRVVPFVLQTGDRVAASIVGNTITTYVNDVEIFHVSDSTFTDGSPGMGFYLQGATGVNGDYGFTCYAAADDGSMPSCATPQTQTIGRATGGGRILTPTGPVTIEYELHCEASTRRNNLEVVWNGGRFRLDDLTSAICSKDPAIAAPSPAPGKADKDRGRGDKDDRGKGDKDDRGRGDKDDFDREGLRCGKPTFNTYQGKGTGRLNNVSGATATWTLTDQGEPGRNDTVAIQIKNRNNVVVLNLSGRLTDGNNNMHK